MEYIEGFKEKINFNIKFNTNILQYITNYKKIEKDSYYILRYIKFNDEKLTAKDRLYIDKHFYIQNPIKNLYSITFLIKEDKLPYITKKLYNYHLDNIYLKNKDTNEIFIYKNEYKNEINIHHLYSYHYNKIPKIKLIDDKLYYIRFDNFKIYTEKLFKYKKDVLMTTDFSLIAPNIIKSNKVTDLLMKYHETIHPEYNVIVYNELAKINDKHLIKSYNYKIYAKEGHDKYVILFFMKYINKSVTLLDLIKKHNNIINLEEKMGEIIETINNLKKNNLFYFDLHMENILVKYKKNKRYTLITHIYLIDLNEIVYFNSRHNDYNYYFIKRFLIESINLPGLDDFLININKKENINLFDFYSIYIDSRINICTNIIKSYNLYNKIPSATLK